MSKKPRPSINDQLAQLSATAPAPLPIADTPRDNVSTLSREDVKTLSRGNVETDRVTLGNPLNSEGIGAERDGYKRRVRFEKPHASVYAHPKVFKALREIAAAKDCKPHDLYLEGLRLVLRSHGRDFDALNRGE